MSQITIADSYPGVNGVLDPRLALLKSFVAEHNETTKRVREIEARIFRQRTLRQAIGLTLKERITPILDSERDYQAEGLSTMSIPYLSKARVTRWKEFQQRQSTDAFSPESNIAIVCGAVSGNLAVIDSETQTDFNWVRSEFESRGINTWTVRTARGGHCYVRTPEPISGRILKLDGRQIEIRGEGQYILAPPSIHPSGTAYQFVSHPSEIARVTFEQLRFLGAVFTAAAPKSYAAKAPRIPDTTYRLLQGEVGGFPSRSEQEYAIVVGLSNAHFTIDEIQVIFSNYPAAGKFQETYAQKPSQAIKWLRSMYRVAQEQGDSKATIATREKIKAAKKVAAGMRWPGRTSASDRKVLLAHLEIALRLGSCIYQASSRELGEKAKVTKDTACSSTNRLLAMEFEDMRIERIQRGKRGTPDTYKVTLADNDNFNTTTIQVEYGRCIETDALLTHELFSSRKLGRTAGAIYANMESPMSPKEVSDKLGIGVRTVQRNLKRMSELVDASGEIHELVKQTSGKWQRVVGVNLDELSKSLGLKRKWALRRREHEVQRSQYHRARNGLILM